MRRALAFEKVVCIWRLCPNTFQDDGRLQANQNRIPPTLWLVPIPPCVALKKHIQDWKTKQMLQNVTEIIWTDLLKYKKSNI